jgi:hypothetical protein
MSNLPGPLRAALGVVATALETARTLPEKAPELPMQMVTTALQYSLRGQQRYAELMVRGDALVGRIRGLPDEAPSWATFDDDDDATGSLPSDLLADFDDAGRGSLPGPQATPPATVAPTKTSPTKTSPAKRVAAKKTTPIKTTPVKTTPVKTTKITKAGPPLSRTSAFDLVEDEMSGDLAPSVIEDEPGTVS